MWDERWDEPGTLWGFLPNGSGVYWEGRDIGHWDYPTDGFQHGEPETYGEPPIDYEPPNINFNFPGDPDLGGRTLQPNHR